MTDYAAGRLHGEWINAAQPPADLIESIGEMLAAAPSRNAEEWGIFDYDGFGRFRLNQYEDLGVVSTVARGITKHGLAFGAWADLLDGERQRLDDFEAAYLGHHDCREAYVDQLLNELDVLPAVGDHVPEWLRSHVTVDRAAIARDLETGSDITVVEAEGGGVYVFNGAY